METILHHRIIRRVLLVLLSLGCTCLGVEIVLRSLCHARQGSRADPEQDLERSGDMALSTTAQPFSLAGLVRPSRYPDTVYELKPNMAGTFCGKRLRTNSLGMRDAGRGGLLGMNLEGLDAREKRSVVGRYQHMVGPEGFTRAMAKLAGLTSERGIPVVFLQGSSNQEQAALIQRLAKKHEFRLVRVGSYTDAYVKRHGIENTKIARRAALWVSATDRHPNARAHTIYVDALMDALVDLGTISGDRILPQESE